MYKEFTYKGMRKKHPELLLVLYESIVPEFSEDEDYIFRIDYQNHRFEVGYRSDKWELSEEHDISKS